MFWLGFMVGTLVGVAGFALVVVELIRWADDA